jgi:DNA gyrase subunit A
VVGRTARGVRGIDLRDGDIVCGAVIVDENKKLLTITENGFGKKTEFSEFESRNRGIMGVIAHNISEKTGKLAAVACVDDEQDVMMITNEGVIIRTRSAEIPTYKRSTSGVHVMRLKDGMFIVNMTVLDASEEENTEEIIEKNTAENEEDQTVADENSATDEEQE